MNLGTALAVRGDFAAAEANFRTALSLDPGYLEAYWKLGDLLCRQKRLDQGIDVLRTAIKIAPAYYPAWRTLGQALANDPQRRDEAIKCYSVLLGQPETARDAAETLGYLYYVKRQPRTALEFWARYLDEVPDSLPVLTMTAWVLATDPDASVRDGSKAAALAQRAKTISRGQSSPVLVALAAAYAEQGNFALAASTVEQANRLPKRPFPEADMMLLLRRYESANRYYDDKALVLLPAGM